MMVWSVGLWIGFSRRLSDLRIAVAVAVARQDPDGVMFGISVRITRIVFHGLDIRDDVYLAPIAPHSLTTTAAFGELHFSTRRGSCE